MLFSRTMIHASTTPIIAGLAMLAFSLSMGAVQAQTVVNPAGTTAIVSTGTFTSGTTSYDAYLNYGTLTVINGSGTSPIFTGSDSGISNHVTGVVLVSGGTFSDNWYGIFNDGYEAGALVTITGGIFTANTSLDLVIDGGAVTNIYGTPFTGNGLTGGFGTLTGFEIGTFGWTVSDGVTQELTYENVESTLNFIQTAPTAVPEMSSAVSFGSTLFGLTLLGLCARRKKSAV
ncbi:MAG: hypothetical protein ACRYFS_25580 [Janthinobacterium lividum]